MPGPITSRGIVDGQQIYDGSHVLAADFGTRQLKDDGGSVIFDWEIGELRGTLIGAIYDDSGKLSIETIGRQLIANDGSTVALDWSDPAVATFSVPIAGDGRGLTGVAASVVTGTATNDDAAAGNVGEYISASVVQASAVSLTTATPKTVTSISLTAGDWDVTAVGSITGASTGTEFDVAIGTTTNSLTGTVLGDTRCQTPTVSLAGADATLMIPAMRVSINTTTIYYLIIQETFTLGSPKAYGRISARRCR